MYKKVLYYSVITVIIFCCFLVPFCVGHLIGYRLGYIDACNDAYTDSLRMFPNFQEDGSINWEWINAANSDHRKQRGRTAPNRAN